jgi:hypothetical protein
MDRASGSSGRRLLGPAFFTGNDVGQVRVTVRARGRFGLELSFDASHEHALADFAAAHARGAPVAMTLDGRVVTAFVLQPGDVTTYGSLWFAPKGGFTRAKAGELRGRFDEARHEQLVGLLESSTMTPAARKVVASVTSSVDDKSKFADDCPLREVPDTLVLGCFGRGTLRVLRVDRPDLAPVMTVSMAHEMLHGAYQQLGPAERHKLDAEIERVYRTLDDPQLTDLVAAYAISEPGRRDDELHSLLGTQVATLSPALERHYRRFFSDRQRVVAAFRSYDDVLGSLEREHDDLKAQLTPMKAQLDDLDARLDEAGARSNDLASQIDDLRAQGRIPESNDLVEAQNAAYREAEALLEQDHALVDQYNALVDRYNQLVQQANEIYDSLRVRTADDPTP